MLEELANKKLWDSVLHEGMLPKYIWAKDGKSGINLSGIAGTEGQEFCKDANTEKCKEIGYVY